MKGAIEMDERLLKLRQQLHAKTMEIEAFVAKQEGMSDLKEMDPAVYQRLRSHVEKLLEEWEEAVHEGTLSGDEESPFIKLARERIEIQQQIADLQDHENR
jgi:hypothetical protein